MAYVLGFFVADGTMIENNRGAHFIEFHIIDLEILVYIKKVMKAEHKIAIRVRKQIHHKDGHRIQIGSKEIFSDLVKIGCMQNKSKVIRLPKIPSKYFGDFLRGYFDGDGCVYFKKLRVKDRVNKKWIFSTRFTSGSLGLLMDIQSVLQHIVQGGFIVNKNRGYDLVFSHKDSLALFDLMYNNSRTFRLKRKYRIFKKAVQTLYGR